MWGGQGTVSCLGKIQGNGKSNWTCLYLELYLPEQVNKLFGNYLKNS